MRVITGRARGHRLKAPHASTTRPMLDRVKESLFSMLESYGAIRGRVLDLYAGSGALGIECLSRGAVWADFVERNASVCRIIRENLAHTRLVEYAHVYQMSVARYLQMVARADTPPGYAIIILDPPYADPQIERTIQEVIAAGLSSPDGLVVVGHSPRVSLADGYAEWERLRLRQVGDSCFSLYQQLPDGRHIPEHEGSGET